MVGIGQLRRDYFTFEENISFLKKIFQSNRTAYLIQKKVQQNVFLEKVSTFYYKKVICKLWLSSEVFFTRLSYSQQDNSLSPPHHGERCLEHPNSCQNPLSSQTPEFLNRGKCDGEIDIQEREPSAQKKLFMEMDIGVLNIQTPVFKIVELTVQLCIFTLLPLRHPVPVLYTS